MGVCPATRKHAPDLGGKTTWESDSGRPRHPRALDKEELFVIKGSQKITSADCAQLQILQNKGFVDIMSRFPRKKSRPKHILCTLLHSA